MLTTIVAVSGLGVAIVAIGISVWVALVSKRDMIVNASSLTLSAYSAAIQGGILNLKGALPTGLRYLLSRCSLTLTSSSLFRII